MDGVTEWRPLGAKVLAESGAAGIVLEATQDLVERRVQPGSRFQLRTQSGLILLTLSVSTSRDRCSELFSVRDTWALPTRPRSDGRSTCASARGRSRKKDGVCWFGKQTVVQAQAAHEEHEPPDYAPKKRLLKLLQV